MMMPSKFVQAQTEQYAGRQRKMPSCYPIHGHRFTRPRPQELRLALRLGKERVMRVSTSNRRGACLLGTTRHIPGFTAEWAGIS
jgi:hypothetical protein